MVRKNFSFKQSVFLIIFPVNVLQKTSLEIPEGVVGGRGGGERGFKRPEFPRGISI